VAGTHGKTTSAAMLAWLLTRTGRDPGYLVGGLPRDLGASAALGTGPWFVVEGDEYDSAYFDKEAKFLHYRPEFVLLNAIEFDHADIYRDVEHVKGAFRKLLALVPAGAPVGACGDFPHVHDVVRGTPSPPIPPPWPAPSRRSGFATRSGGCGPSSSRARTRAAGGSSRRSSAARWQLPTRSCSPSRSPRRATRFPRRNDWTRSRSLRTSCSAASRRASCLACRRSAITSSSRRAPATSSRSCR